VTSLDRVRRVGNGHIQVRRSFMAGVNKVILIGNLGADPELRYTSGGSAVADLRLATTRKYTTKDGTSQEDTQWHRIVVWGKQAENCKEYLSKGRQVYVEGRLQTRQWEDRDGNKRYTTEVVAVQVQFLGGGRGGGGGGVDGPPPPANGDMPPDLGDDDIPF
jgi:single-strand DNA-binding protein